MVKSPYAESSMMVAVESGAANAGQWVKEERNILKNYKKAFGGGYVPMISGVTIMTDYDNTDESATAWYGDIIFLAEKEELRHTPPVNPAPYGKEAE